MVIWDVYLIPLDKRSKRASTSWGGDPTEQEENMTWVESEAWRERKISGDETRKILVENNKWSLPHAFSPPHLLLITSFSWYFRWSSRWWYSRIATQHDHVRNRQTQKLTDYLSLFVDVCCSSFAFHEKDHISNSGGNWEFLTYHHRSVWRWRYTRNDGVMKMMRDKGGKKNLTFSHAVILNKVLELMEEHHSAILWAASFSSFHLIFRPQIPSKRYMRRTKRWLLLRFWEETWLLAKAPAAETTSALSSYSLPFNQNLFPFTLFFWTHPHLRKWRAKSDGFSTRKAWAARYSMTK